ncbi:PREDICTED: uncharacterized protein LOC105121512 isoform X2 [Populus euphratica]|uniref:Uncharacterized protein LOC105121512 isoform X2 n=1 Tax=Populus euphratica TaxID=75702 RepID=A0AAJ6TWS7_POPEU|nr:PREDICTED: uncharacterized protein LOC105121512 isoform X2 [Populus euphratica]
MQVNTAYAYTCGSSLATMLHPVSAPTATHVMMERDESDEKITGFIFLCNGETKPECYRYRVFGLPRGNLDIVEKIKPGTKLFLFDFGVKRLYGIYTAVSRGGMNLEPAAFNGKFPAQVRFKIVSDCLPLAESALKHAIKDNYQGSKFRQELSAEQVKTLVSLFRPIDLPPSISVVPIVANVEKVLPSARPYSLYFPGATHPHTFPGGWIQPSKHLHYVHQNTLPQSNQKSSAETSQCTYDPQRSYEVAMETGLRNHVARHENQYHVPQLPRGRDTVLHSDNVANYYSQYLPSATTSCISSQAQDLAPSYALTASSSKQQPLQSTYQSHYTPLIHENQSLLNNDHLQWSMLGTSGAAEAYLPVSARYSFAGAASTYQ